MPTRLIVATGQLHQPAFPGIPGRRSSPATASTPRVGITSIALRAGTCAVVGTGASAIQFIPEVAEHAARLYVFQRTGNWFLPRKNRPYLPLSRR